MAYLAVKEAMGGAAMAGADTIAKTGTTLCSGASVPPDLIVAVLATEVPDPA
jgi:hypothetical protein